MLIRFAIVITAMLLLVSVQADAQTTWFKYEGNPVLTKGAPGSWESNNVWQARIVRVSDTLKMFYTGDIGIETHPQIGLAWSTDGGITWTKYASNPVMGPTQAWEGTWVYSPSVLFTGGDYKMWYTGSYNQTTRLGYAHSSDGIHWSKCASNPVLGAGPSTWEGASVMFPSVLADTTGFKMWYSGMPGGGTPIHVGYASAVNETTWTKPNSTNPVLAAGSAGSWDADALRSATVIHDETAYRMWYTGGYGGTGLKFGIAMSSDGLTWTKDAVNNPVMRPGSSAWDAGGIASCDVLSDGSLYHMWYGGGSSNIFGSIGYAVSPKGFLAVLSPGSKVAAGDMVTITVHVDSPHGLSFVAYIDSSVGTSKIRLDTVRLYDDGLHGDSLAGDGLFANRWPASVRGNYGASVSLTLNDTVRFGPIDAGGIEVVGARHQVPQDYATIQVAIDASADGDTVLVSENTYRENIRFRGKAITLGSLYLVDGDTTHIEKTIIDGSGSAKADSASVVYFIDGEDTTSVLAGFTIRGGSGTLSPWNNSAYGNFPTLGGGGIFCHNAGARIMHNTVEKNRVVAGICQGGGIYAVGTGPSYPYLILEDNRVRDNYVQGTGSTSMLWGGGGGVALAGVEARVVQNIVERDTAIGYMGAYGGGIAFIAYTTGRWPGGLFARNVIRSNVIRSAVQGAVGAGMSIMWTGQVTLQENVIEDNTATCTSSNSGWAEGGGVEITDQDITGYGRKIILNNRFLGNSISASYINDGAGLLVYRTLSTISGNEFTDNSVEGVGLGPNRTVPGGGGGVSLYYSSFRLENCIFTHNSSRVDGGAVLVIGAPQSGTEQVIVNGTIVDNHAASTGAGMRVHYAPGLLAQNTIFWGDTAGTGGEIDVAGPSPTVQYCDVQGSWPGTGNIDKDPQLALPRLDSLKTSSPCIGAGITTSTPLTDIHGHPRTQPAGSVTDIGAEESFLDFPSSDDAEEETSLPAAFALFQNYPNPFNPTTTIRYALPHRSHVTLTVFNLLGQPVTNLVNGEIEAGYHSVTLDASGLSSGVYFYRMETGSYVAAKKFVLVK